MTAVAVKASRGRVNWLASWLTPLLALLGYLLFWPIPVEPQGWHAPKDKGYNGPHVRNEWLSGLNQVQLGAGQEGPEYIARHGDVLYTGLSNGDVLSLSTDGAQQAVVANTGGRPLGLAVAADGSLLVADAMRGLLRIRGQGAQAHIDTLLTEVDHPVAHDPVRYADAVEVSPDGRIWLTDASRRFGAKALGSTFEASVLDILEHSCTGRVIVLDAQGGQPKVALAGLCFPNGMVFSQDGQHMFLAETGTFRVLKVDLAKLATVRAADPAGVPRMEEVLQQGAAVVLLDNLPGYPDNLTRGEEGRIWVGLTKPRSPVLDMSAEHPWVRSLTLRLPRSLWPVPKAYGHVIAFNEAGRIVADLQDPTGAYPETTSATEANGRLFIQSLHAHTMGWKPYLASLQPH